MSQLLAAIEHEAPKVTSNIPLVHLPDRSQRTTPRISTEAYAVPGNVSLLDPEPHYLPKGRTIIVIATLAGVTLVSSLSTGLLTVGIPRMALDVNLPEHLLLWPVAVYVLTNGACMLLAGSIADVVGNRIINLAGCLLVGIFIIACGLARSGIELIMFRALQGIAVSLCLPTSIAIVANAVPSGRQRNIGFSTIGFVQPFGFSVGLVLGGVFVDTVGWRFGWYICGGLTLVLFAISIWALPKDKVSETSNMARLQTEIDWIGAAMSCACLGLFSYVLATLTNSNSSIRHPSNIVMLTISIALVPAFIFWERRQERGQKPALIPNSLWKNTVFTSVCLMVVFSYAVANAMEQFCVLYFQEVQHLSGLQASIRILPSLIVGCFVQVFTGLLVHRIPAFYLVLGALLLSSGAPLLMAVIRPAWPYWYDAFFAQLLSPLSADLLFTVGLLVVSDVFPTRTQALAGAVFNTVAQFGTGTGLTLMAVISSSATQKSGQRNKLGSEALMVGYRASFWAAFAWMVVACVIGAFGLRRMGKVGVKRD